MKYIIGVDFDNTIIRYDHLMHKIAREWDLIPPMCPVNKEEIRCVIRERPNGEISWQKLQANVYGPQIMQARIFEDASSFFEVCKKTRTPVFIVSHKTEYAAQDCDNINLRAAAFHWMEQNKFFDFNGLGLSREHVYFEPTRKEKIDRIKSLGCTHFIDDLTEVFLDSTFPKNIIKILFSPSVSDVSLPDGEIAISWQEIYNLFF